jgi:hypothetical protein
MNKCELLKASLAKYVAGIQAGSPVTIEVKQIGTNEEMYTNTKNHKSMRITYLPENDRVMLETGSQRKPLDIAEPIDDFAFQLLRNITG